MQKKAKELVKGDTVIVAGNKFTVQSTELSAIGKQGSRKCRLELKKPTGEVEVIVRPEDYPFNLA